MKSILSKILKPLASLRLTVILLALSMIVVFAGTVAQIRSDVWTVQKRFFHSFFLWINLADYFPSIGDWSAIDALVAEDFDGGYWFNETRLPGCPAFAARSAPAPGTPPAS